MGRVAARVTSIEACPRHRAGDAIAMNPPTEYRHPPRAAVLAAFLFIAAFLPSMSCAQTAESKTEPDVLATLRPGHPRLYFVEDDLPRVRTLIDRDPQARAWRDGLRKTAERMLAEPVAQHVLVGPRMLQQSRNAFRRVSTLAGLYRLDGDRRFAERARAEMLACAAFPDWNPAHFLDAAEMTHALAVGYDWLFDVLTSEDRAAVRAAIVEKGLRPGLDVYKGRRWWADMNHNWNQVCNGGLTLGALAVADEAPDLARQVLAFARDSIRRPMQEFAPDGGWPEGPVYWNYATHYNVYYLAALQTALGADFGLKASPGFAETGLFRMHALGPSGKAFNFADATESAAAAPQMFWLARAFDRPLYARHERERVGERGEIFHLLWAGDPPDAGRAADPSPDALFRRVNVAFFRSAWDDPNAVWVGFKGGDNRANHAHLDLGSFVLDALGERWAVDLGRDDYDLPGYFGPERWSYFRLRTESHNTLLVDGANQARDAGAPLVAFLSSPARAFAVSDLTAAYAPKVTRAWRGVALLDRRRVLVEDEVEAREPVEVRWNFLTRAAIDARGDRATLAQGKAKLEARILSPQGARFELLPANPPPPQAQDPDVKNLAVCLPDKVRDARIAVLIGPAGDAAPPPAVEPIEAWIAAGRLDKK